jgi:glycosidase
MQLFVKIFLADGAINNAFTKEGRTETQNEYFDFTAKLFNWQNENSYSFWNNDALHSKRTMYAYFRYNNNETVMVVMNKQ